MLPTAKDVGVRPTAAGSALSAAVESVDAPALAFGVGGDVGDHWGPNGGWYGEAGFRLGSSGSGSGVCASAPATMKAKMASAAIILISHPKDLSFLLFPKAEFVTAVNPFIFSH